MYIARFVYPFFLQIDGLVGGFNLLAIANNAATNTGVQISVRVLLSIILSVYLGPELLVHVVILCLNVWGTLPYYFPWRLHHFTFLPAMPEGPVSLLLMSHFFVVSQPQRKQEVCHCARPSLDHRKRDERRARLPGLINAQKLEMEIALEVASSDQ